MGGFHCHETHLTRSVCAFLAHEGVLGVQGTKKQVSVVLFDAVPLHGIRKRMTLALSALLSSFSCRLTPPFWSLC